MKIAYNLIIYVDYDMEELHDKLRDRNQQHERSISEISFAQGRPVELAKPQFYPQDYEVLELLASHKFNEVEWLRGENGRMQLVIAPNKGGGA